jgi:hypothetical protein
VVGHLERVRRLGRGTDDQPELVGIGVVEQLSNVLGFDQQTAEWLERVKVLVDPDPTRALEQDVQLMGPAVAVSRRCLAGRQPP